MACAVAEHFRDEGLDVLLLIDSVTRFAMAQREIGLVGGRAADDQGLHALGVRRIAEAAGARGAGASKARRARSPALFTVLVDGDDHNEPIADAVRGILDGHIVMERAIAERGRYPAINVLKSISRLMPMCHTAEENALIAARAQRSRSMARWKS